MAKKTERSPSLKVENGKAIWLLLAPGFQPVRSQKELA